MSKHSAARVTLMLLLLTLGTDRSFGAEARVHWDGQWRSPLQIVELLADDLDYQKYRQQRDKLAGDPKRVFHLARWCATHGLNDFADFHFRQVAQNSAASERLQTQAFKQLGLELFDGQWLTAEQVAERKATIKRQQKLAKRWADDVRRWTESLASSIQRRASVAREQMAGLDDIDAIPLLEQSMSLANEPSALAVVYWLSQHAESLATDSLLKHALYGGTEPVKQAAIDALAKRPLHEFVPQLLGDLIPPVESRFMVTYSSAGLVVHRHQLLRQGKRMNDAATADFLRINGPLSLRGSRARGTSWLEVPRNESIEARVERFQRTQVTAFEAGVRSAKIEREVAAANAPIAQHNTRLFQVLNGTTDAALPAKPNLWWDWWDDYNERFVPPKLTRFRYGLDQIAYAPIYDHRASCFVAGTPVHTDRGAIAIETIEPGERVLAQDVDTGELTYKIVTATTVRPPSPLLAIRVGGEPIVATLGHPFWVNGKGWRMAKQLAVGDVLHTLEGPFSIESISSVEPAAAYNLVVTGVRDYFVGKAGVLVHDNQPRQPTISLTLTGFSR